MRSASGSNSDRSRPRRCPTDHLLSALRRGNEPRRHTLGLPLRIPRQHKVRCGPAAACRWDSEGLASHQHGACPSLTALKCFKFLGQSPPRQAIVAADDVPVRHGHYQGYRLSSDFHRRVEDHYATIGHAEECRQPGCCAAASLRRRRNAVAGTFQPGIGRARTRWRPTKKELSSANTRIPRVRQDFMAMRHIGRFHKSEAGVCSVISYTLRQVYSPISTRRTGSWRGTPVGDFNC